MKTKRISSKQLIALVLILIGAVSSIFGITGLTKSSSEDPYESRNGIVMVYATVYDNEGTAKPEREPAGPSARPDSRFSTL